jgi:quercetin dioxygenase-like cupin family protein
MPIPHAKTGEVIDLRPLGEALAHAVTNTLVKTDRLEIIRFVVSAGKEWHGHQVIGEITVQCLEGRVAFTAGGTTRELAAGQMLYLAGNEPHSLRGIENASVLVTILLHQQRGDDARPAQRKQA